MSKLIKLVPFHKNLSAIVDDEDFEFLIQWVWRVHGNGYACRVGTKKDGDLMRRNIMMHRVINKTPEGMFTDHINRNKLDNRKTNLRTCHPGQNSFNQGKQGLGKTTSKYRGVFWASREGKWEAKIYAKRKQYFIGYFDSEIAASKAFDKKAKELYGEFAGLNHVC